MPKIKQPKITLTKKELNDLIKGAIREDRNIRGSEKQKEVKVTHKIDMGSYISKKIWDLALRP